MLKERFDLVTQLHDEILRFRILHDIAPETIILSPAAFEWLLAVFQEDKRILGVSPINTDDWTYDTGISTLQIMIDETLDDYSIDVQ